jgi:hypothetical protein
MDRGRKRPFLPLSFFLFFFVSFLFAKEINFKGFRLHNPHQLLRESDKVLSASQIKNVFEQSGFFRTVSLFETQHSLTITVVEYPLLNRVTFKGNSMYDHNELLEFLGLKPGIPFNSRLFNEHLTSFYKRCKIKGFTHWQVTGVKIDGNGHLLIDIDEGIFQEVEVANDLIETGIVRNFFRHLLNKPFNSRDVKYILEEMLFTEAFYTIRSEVLRRDGKVILRLIPDKKQMRKLAASIEYSGYGGFQAYNLISGAKPGNRLNFLDLTARFIDQGDSTVFQLIIDPHDYRRYLDKSRFSLSMEAFYTAIEGHNDLSVRFRPRWFVSLFKQMSFFLFFSGGIHKNFDGLENQLIAESGVGLRYGYRSPLIRTSLKLGLELALSVLHDYHREQIHVDFTQQLFLGDIKLFGQWNLFSGDSYPFNVCLIPFERAAIINADQLLVRDSLFISAEFSSRPIARLFRAGLIAQYVRTDRNTFGYGLTLHLNIKGFPIRMAGFIHDGTFYVLASLRISM